MAGISTAEGVPVYERKLFPIWLSRQIIKEWRRNTIIERITTTDHTAQLAQGGQTVDITLAPKVTINNYTKGAETPFEHLNPATVQLVIDKAKQWGYHIFDIDRRQATLEGFWTEMAAEAGKDLAEEVEEEFFADIIDDAASYNLGATAGKKWGDVNLGTTAAPVSVNNQTVANALLRPGNVLSQSEAKDKGMIYMVTTPTIVQLIKESPYGQVFVTGDEKSPLRSGSVGMIDQFKVFECNRLPVSGSGSTAKHPIIFGNNKSIIFYTQYQNTKKRPGMVDVFSDLVAGLQVYGYKAHRPEGFGVMWAQLADNVYPTSAT